MSAHRHIHPLRERCQSAVERLLVCTKVEFNRVIAARNSGCLLLVGVLFLLAPGCATNKTDFASISTARPHSEPVHFEGGSVVVRSQDQPLQGGWSGLIPQNTERNVNGSHQDFGFVSPGHSFATQVRLRTPRFAPPSNADSNLDRIPETSDTSGTQPPGAEFQSGLGQPGPLPSINQSVGNTIPANVAPQSASVPDPAVVREPTIMERFRELYQPRRAEMAAVVRDTEETTSALIARPFRRLQNPWGLLLPREEQAAERQNSSSTALIEDSADSAGSGSPPESNMDDQSATGAALESERVTEQSSEYLIAVLIEQYQARIQAWPRDADGVPANPEEWRRVQTDLRLLNLISGDSAEAVAAIEGLPAAEREFWQSILMAMTVCRQSRESSAEDFTAEWEFTPAVTSSHQLDARSQEETRYDMTAQQLRAAIRHLQSMSRLTIRRAAFCSRIQSFGTFETFPTTDFNSGQPVLVYAEIDNFRTERSKEGTYDSRFSAQIDILRNDDPGPVESIPVEGIIDQSTSPRTDYYHSYELTIPQLAPGRYTLQLTVRDEIARQEATSILPFHVR